MLGEERTLFVRAVTKEKVCWRLNEEEIDDVEADSTVYILRHLYGLMLQLPVLNALLIGVQPTEDGPIYKGLIFASKAEVVYIVKTFSIKSYQFIYNLLKPNCTCLNESRGVSRH